LRRARIACVALSLGREENEDVLRFDFRKVGRWRASTGVGSGFMRPRPNRLVPSLLTALHANDYRLIPVGCFSSVASLVLGACADAAGTAIASALAMARVATGFSHSNAMKAATMSQAIMT